MLRARQVDEYYTRISFGDAWQQFKTKALKRNGILSEINNRIDYYRNEGRSLDHNLPDLYTLRGNFL